jgi:hypothetical protein
MVQRLLFVCRIERSGRRRWRIPPARAAALLRAGPSQRKADVPSSAPGECSWRGEYRRTRRRPPLRKQECQAVAQRPARHRPCGRCPQKLRWGVQLTLSVALPASIQRNFGAVKRTDRAFRAVYKPAAMGGRAAEGRAYGGGRVRAPGARTLATLARPRLEAAPPRLPAQAPRTRARHAHRPHHRPRRRPSWAAGPPAAR